MGVANRWGVWLIVAGCASPPCGRPAGEGDAARSNVLLVVLDDVGMDQLSRWGLGQRTAETPTVDCLCDRGLRFTRVWANALCSPARAEILTGRTALQNGISHNIEPGEQLASAETTVAEVLGDAGYATGLVGKWHLGGFTSPDGADGPNLQGFDRFAGSLANLSVGRDDAPVDLGYDHWLEVEDGDAHTTRVYATEETTDQALDFLRSAPEPWFLEVSFNAPHVPLTPPPPYLNPSRVTRDAPKDARYRASLEAADTELGVILRALPPSELADTTIVVIGDNGTSVEAGGDPAFAGKGTTAEAGLRVPMVIAGPQVDGAGVSGSLVSVADLLPTFAAIARAELPPALDGRDLDPVFADPQAVVHDLLSNAVVDPDDPTALLEAARDDRFKLRRQPGQPDALYAPDDATLDEGLNLALDGINPTEQAALARLGAALGPAVDPGGR